MGVVGLFCQGGVKGEGLLQEHQLHREVRGRRREPLVHPPE